MHPLAKFFRVLKSRSHRAIDLAYLAELNLHGVEVGIGVRVEGRANIQRLAGRIRLGDGVVLRSRDYQYHSHILPTKLLTDEDDAFIDIGERSRLNGVAIHAKSQIVIGSDCYFAAGTAILDCHGHVLDADRRVRGMRDDPSPIRIGDRVWTGLNVLVLKGVVIGNDTVVGAGSIVTSDLPAGTLCAGQPARVIRYLHEVGDEIKGDQPGDVESFEALR